MRSMHTLVVPKDEAGVVEQAQVLTLLQWLFLDFGDHVRVADSSGDIALEAGSGSCNSIITLRPIRLIEWPESEGQTYILASWRPHRWM